MSLIITWMYQQWSVINVFRFLKITIGSEVDPSRRPYFTCKDMVNYKALEGHQYEIIENPNRDTERNSRLYVCKYDNCDRIFTKTWNLVYHFRIHTGEKPYNCEHCDKTFAQKSNLVKHRVVHYENIKTVSLEYLSDILGFYFINWDNLMRDFNMLVLVYKVI